MRGFHCVFCSFIGMKITALVPAVAGKLCCCGFRTSLTVYTRTELTKNFACEAEEIRIQIHTLIGKSRSFNTWIFVAILELKRIVTLYKELIINQQAKLIDFGESS